MSANADLLAQRYGRRPSDPVATRRRLTVALVTFVVLGVVFVGWASLQRVRGEATWHDLGLTAATPSSIDVTFQVAVPANTGAICTVRAMNERLVEVGRIDVEIPPSPQGLTTRTITVPTAEKATTGGVKICVRR